MKKSGRGRKPQYTWLVVYCLGKLHMDEIRRLNKEHMAGGFTQTEIHDCVREFIGIKNPDIIRNAIYDAITHGWATAIRAHRHGRSLFMPTKSGLALYLVFNELLFDINLLVSYSTSPVKFREEIKHALSRFGFVLDGLISQLSFYETLARAMANPFEYGKIHRRLNLLREIKKALFNYDKEVPTVIEARRIHNAIRHLIEVFKIMEIGNVAVLCNAADRIINGADPSTWSEDALG